jgi:histidine triad (HIT) family protein
MRTAIGARAIRPLATMRTASPGRNPNSASRLPNSTGVVASAADTETTRARVPMPKSVSRISVGAGAGVLVWAVVDMDAILYENRSHYYYGSQGRNSAQGRPGGAAANPSGGAVPANLQVPESSEAVEMPTLFEKIIAGDLPATVLYRDPRVIAFLDIRPAAPVHILIVPNKPIPTANDIADEDESLIGHMIVVARDLARSQGIAESGYRLIINCNADGGQEVYHLHVHLLGGRPLGPMVSRA